ncbi:MAG: hypothetical protein ABJC63_00070 [Gemmatimonadales bacterium]
MLTVLGIIVLVNIAVPFLARSSSPRQRLKTIQESGPVTDLFFGNSLIDAGVDARAFELGFPGRKAVNLGLGATAPVEHYLMLLASARLRPSAVYYGFVDTELTDSIRADFSALSGNRAMVYYVYPDTAIRYYASESHGLEFLLRLGRLIPMVVDRTAIWGRVEKLRRRIERIGLPAEATSRFGRDKDFAEVAALGAASFRSHIGLAVARRRPLTAPILGFIQTVHRRGAAVVFIAMPMPTTHRLPRYGLVEWANYKGYIQRLLEAQGARLIDATDWVPDDGFLDPFHLAPSGAAIFSRRLGQTLGSDMGVPSGTAH